MNDNVKGVLRLIADRVRAALEGDELALEDLHETLASSSLTAEEIQAALDTILALTEPNREDLDPESLVTRGGNRVLSVEERSRLTTEAYGYLLGVRGEGTIDEEEFEWVLERALASGERPIGLPEIQGLVLEVALGPSFEPGGDRGEFPAVH